MYVAAARISLHLPSSSSLKDRRRVVRSLVDRAHTRFNVAIADVGVQDRWQVAELGVSVVSGSATHARERLDEVVRFVEEFSPEAIVTQVDADTMAFDD